MAEKAALLAVVVAVAAAGCGGSSGGGGDADLEFTRADGSTASFPETVRAWCGPFDESAPSVAAVNVLAGERAESEPAEPFWMLVASRSDVEEPTTLPNDFVHTDPQGANLFVLDDAEHANNELSSATEESSGTIDVELSGCEPGDTVRVEFDDVTLGSEYSDQPTMSVAGRVEAEIGSAP